MARSTLGLLQLISEPSLRRLADSRSFERGRVYADDGSVQNVKVTKTKVVATVYGTGIYDVRLGVRNGDVTFSCSCPVGDDGDFCKHCVAVALCTARVPMVKEEKVIDVESYLQGLDHAELVRLVLDAADIDADFERRLHLDAAHVSPSASAITAFKGALDQAFYARDYVDYREAYGFASGIDSVLDSIERFLRTGDAVAVVDLAEYACTKLNEAIQYVDDSDGNFGGVSVHIADLHLAACKKAKLDSEALAERLFRLELHGGDLDTFHDSALSYKSLLKKKGFAHFRELVEDAWSKVPALGPDDDRDYGHYRITHMMETFAEMTGDVDAVVDVLAKDLSSPWRYVGIIEKFREAKRFDDALAWARRGIDAFGPTSDYRLVEAAVEEYHRAGRSDNAVDLAWQYFDHRPDLASYQRLSEHAQRAGSWDKFRTKALRRVRAESKERPGTKSATTRTARSRSATAMFPSRFDASASTLVQIFLWEGDVDQAWKEAKAGGCSRPLWMELAAKREKGHPLDVIPIYQDEIEATIGIMGNDAYAKAVKLIAHVGKLMKVTGVAGEFDPYVADIRTRHKSKRNLMKLFADRGWL